MRSTVTMKHLEAVVARINRAAGTPETPWTKQKDGKIKSNIGNYHIDNAYGGVQLVQMMNEGGGIRVMTNGGFVTKRELCNQLHTFLAGLEEGRAA